VDDGNTDAADAYSLLEARGGLREIRVGRASLSPFAGVGNILNRRYVTAVSINAFGGRFFDPGPSRSAYLGLRILLGYGRDSGS
jgi:iron complex outermembrane receptor protein